MAETTKVVAEDGSTHEFGEKQKVKKQSSIQEGGTVVTKFVFRNGAVRTHETAPDSPIYSRLAMHGADQKFGDEFAGLEDVEDCVEAFDEMSKRLARNEWSEKRTSDGLAGSSMLARALVKLYGKTLDEVKERLSTLDAKTKQALSRDPKVAEVIAQIKAEQAAKKPAKDAIDPSAAMAAFLG